MLLAFGGICTALSVIALWVSTVFSINTLTFIALASFFIGVMYIEGGNKYAILTYAAVSLLSFVLPVNKMSVLYYAGFFGYYPILKSFIEKIRNITIELIIKTAFFTLVAFLGIYVLTAFMSVSVSEKLPWQAVAAVGVVAFHLYDYALSILLEYYVRKIRSKIRR